MEEGFVLLEPNAQIEDVEADEVEKFKSMFKRLFLFGVVLYFFTLLAII